MRLEGTKNMYSKRNKYEPLGEYLQQSKSDEITLTFSQIEDVLGFYLPQSALKYEAWWANGGHTQADAWLGYGYKVKSFNLVSRKVTFMKTGLASATSAKSKPIIRQKALMPEKAEAEKITVCGYEFSFLQELKPEIDINGNVKEYSPQNDYKNEKGKSLHRYGSGTFCRFSIDAGKWPGVYLWIVDGEILYIGETSNLVRRFNTGYGAIAGINCFEGGQTTNCKMNKLVLDLAKAGKVVKLYFFSTMDYKKVELELLRAINTRYNVKDN